MQVPPHKRFQLLLFHRDLAFSARSIEAGVDGLIVDLERRGKAARQNGFDTEINAHSLADLRALKALNGADVLCRINGPSKQMSQEIEAVLNAGADEIIVPMIRHITEAEEAVAAIGTAARITLMIETQEAAEIVPALCALPIQRVYVGLNDLRISRGSASIFTPLVDGALERICAAVTEVEIGFGGLTLAGFGDPLPVDHLVGELARLGADFTFLRRSFYRDLTTHDPKQVFDQMRHAICCARNRNAAQVTVALDQMKRAITALEATQNG